MKASLSRGGGAFLVAEICSCAQREPSSLLPDVWVKWVHLPQSFLRHSCIWKCFRWRDSNKMQPGEFRGKEMSCHHPCRLFMNWDTWTDPCPTEGMLQSSHCFPGNSFLGFFFMLEYTESEITEGFFLTHSRSPWVIFPLILFFHDPKSSYGERSKIFLLPVPAALNCPTSCTWQIWASASPTESEIWLS